MHNKEHRSWGESGQRDAHHLRAELAKAAQDRNAQLKAGLAKLALEGDSDRGKIAARLRTYFLTGVVIVGPVAVTLYVISHVIFAVDAWMKPIIPSIYDPGPLLPFAVPGIGSVLAIAMLICIGALAANLLVRSLISAGELMLARMPIVRNIYRGLKEIFVSVLTATGANKSIQRVALVQFPSKGIWSLGFVTGEAADEIRCRASAGNLLSIFIVHGLLPPSGIICFVPREEVILIKMSVEDAARIILSAGMADPGRSPGRVSSG
jgi:uncharacterized membrane protein